MTRVDRDVRITTSDGVELSTDLHWPSGDGPFPTLLQRTCYGKEILAEYSGIDQIVAAGYLVLMQDCRGTGLSSGIDDMYLEGPDGFATVSWIGEQPWFDGRLGTFGASYMSFTQYALAAMRPPHLKAMVVGGMGTQRGVAWFPGGTLALDIILSWAATRVFGMEATLASNQESLNRAFDHLPLHDADLVAFGHRFDWFQEGLRHPTSDDPFWSGLDHTAALDLEVPLLMVDGWYDFALPQMLRDFVLRRAVPAPTRFVIGPWTHFSASDIAFDETIRWLDRHVKGVAIDDEPAPLSVYVMPDGGWHDLDGWPPPSETEAWYLQPNGGLATALAPSSSPTTYVYDPADPTPALGGPSLRMENCGPVDNRELEARDDVLTFTSGAFATSVEYLGPVAVQLFLRSDVDDLDVFVRLCDVDTDGVSINLADGIRRLHAADLVRDVDGTIRVTVDLWPTGHAVRPGHRLRLQLSGGAHPMFARNTCSGEPLGSASQIVVAHNAVHHDPAYPSALLLPRVPSGEPLRPPSGER